MSILTKKRFKAQKRREYLRDTYHRKPGIIAWLQRLVMFMMLCLLGLFLLILTDVVHAGIFDETLPRVSLNDVSRGSLLLSGEENGVYRQVKAFL